MSTLRLYEIYDEPDKLLGFLQIFHTAEGDPQGWREVIGRRCSGKGSEPFGSDYVPVPLELNNEGRPKKKNLLGDICLSMKPFVIFSDRAREVLDAFLSPVGEFLEVDAPVPGFIGYRVLKFLDRDRCVDLENSTYTRYDDGKVLVRKAAMYEDEVQGHDVFAVRHTLSYFYVSEAFRQAVKSAKPKLKGFNFGREVPLTQRRSMGSQALTSSAA